MSRRLVLKHPIVLVGMLLCVSCLLIVIVTVLELPEALPRNREMGIYHPTFRSKKVPQNFKLGKFGEMMVEMLPQDLAVTIFIPSEEAFKRDLHLSVNESLVTEKFNDTYAILTRILGFQLSLGSYLQLMYLLVSWCPMILYLGSNYTSQKASIECYFLNRIRSKIIDGREGRIVMHIMDGVIMDSDFEQSVLSDDAEE